MPLVRRSTRRLVISRSSTVTGLLLASLICFASHVSAQSIGASVNAETATPIPGVGHDYIHLLSETVDPASGQLNLRIVPPMPKGRGLTFPFSIMYNSAGVHRLDSNNLSGIKWTPESFVQSFPIEG